MKSTLLKAAFAALIMLAGAQAAQAEELRFGVAAEPYPPFAYKDSAGNWKGFEIDLMNAVCKEMKADCKLTEVAWDGIIPALNEKKIDVIWSSMTITAARKQVIDFTVAYYDSATAIIGAKSDTTKVDLKHPETVAGKIFGVQTATIHADVIQKYFGKTAEVKFYDVLDNALVDLAAGRVDYVQEGLLSLNPFLKSDRGKDFEVKTLIENEPLLGEGVGGGLRKGDPIKAKIDAAIKAVTASGEYAKIENSYPELAGNLIRPKIN
ncbi:MAG: transporter substrate-binding domain-containing protein [Dongiaceae bacterium]